MECYARIFEGGGRYFFVAYYAPSFNFLLCFSVYLVLYCLLASRSEVAVRLIALIFFFNSLLGSPLLGKLSSRKTFSKIVALIVQEGQIRLEVDKDILNLFFTSFRYTICVFCALRSKNWVGKFYPKN